MSVQGWPFGSSTKAEPVKVSRKEYDGLIAARAKELAGSGAVSDVHTGLARKELNRRVKDKELSIVGYIYPTAPLSKDDLAGYRENGNRKP